MVFVLMSFYAQMKYDVSLQLFSFKISDRVINYYLFDYVVENERSRVK